MEWKKKNYYIQAFEYVKNIDLDSIDFSKLDEATAYYKEVNQKRLAYNSKNDILEEGYHFRRDDDWGIYERASAVLFPYVLDYYTKTNIWLSESIFGHLPEMQFFYTLDTTFKKLLDIGYKFKIDEDDFKFLSEVNYSYDGYISNDTLKRLVDEGCVFEGDCDYKPDFNITIQKQQ